MFAVCVCQYWFGFGAKNGPGAGALLVWSVLAARSQSCIFQRGSREAFGNGYSGFYLRLPSQGSPER